MAEDGGDFSQRKPAGGQRFGGHNVDLEASITLIDLKGKAESWAEV